MTDATDKPTRFFNYDKNRAYVDIEEFRISVSGLVKDGFVSLTEFEITELMDYAEQLEKKLGVSANDRRKLEFCNSLIEFVAGNLANVDKRNIK